MTILYLGHSLEGSTSYHRAKALERIGHTVVIEDLHSRIVGLIKSEHVRAFHFRTGFLFLQTKATAMIRQIVKANPAPDLVWVNSGELLNPTSLKLLKKFNCPIVLYNNDDPTGSRDGNRFKLLLKSIPYYDLCVVMRSENIQEFYNYGAKKVLRVFMSYDEVAHKPFDSREEIPEKFRSDVAFIGTWMRNEHRDDFMAELIKHGINVSIWGDRWEKSPIWHFLKPYHRGNMITGRDYVAAIQGSTVCIGLLSKGNRDQHTQRSLEIPYIGGLLCAQRTPEHEMLYTDNTDAVFWSDARECAAICDKILKHPEIAEAIRISGAKKIRKLDMGNENVCECIIESVLKTV